MSGEGEPTDSDGSKLEIAEEPILFLVKTVGQGSFCCDGPLLLR
jgi:hypothetical protein